MNQTLDLIENRFSTRTFSDEPITAEEREAVLHAAMRAPTAGNMLLYSIIEVTDQALKERLAETCDHQPFIAKAPWVLVFLADWQKWIDLFAHTRVRELQGVAHRMTPGPGDLMLAANDAIIAAQNAVVAAESLGIGSCYIGDILENGEIHAELLGLPRYTMPVTMLVLGRPKSRRAPQPRYTRNVVQENCYHRPSADELAMMTRELGEMHSPHGFAEGIANEPQAVYKRKYTSDFMVEMNRSVAWWLERWSTPEEA